MPWKDLSIMSQRHEFVMLAQREGANIRALCRAFEISAQTAYKWLGRFHSENAADLCDRSRRPQRSPTKTSAALAAAVLEVRAQHPAWGGRKIRARLLAMGTAPAPAASTITEILRRAGQVDPEEAVRHRAFVRFEHEHPNDLWQMDFKGDFSLPRDLGRCYPLTVLDDHSRFAVGLRACRDQTTETVQSHLVELFRCYGLPRRMLMDNGVPWGDHGRQPYTRLTVWLMRLRIRVTHGRPYHPQTQGKDERFHRTLNVEVLKHNCFRDWTEGQHKFDRWRDLYNLERPHEALEMAVPASRYEPSPRLYPKVLPPIEYASDIEVRRVQYGGIFHFRGREYRVSKAFKGYPIGVCPTTRESVLDVRFCDQWLGQIDLTQPGKDVIRPPRPNRAGPHPRADPNPAVLR